MHRYIRQRLLPGMGEAGQRRLSRARVAVVGAGGLGAPALYDLASAGVGHIKIIDADRVDITNLNRQIIHFEADIGRAKAQSAKEKIERYNSSIEVSAQAVMLEAHNAQELLRGSDLVLSCVDNEKTRRLLGSVCAALRIPLIVGGVQGFPGYVLAVIPGTTPCRAHIFPETVQKEQPAAAVLGAAAGVIGSLMAMEAIKYIAGMPRGPYFYYIDLLDYRITPIQTAGEA